MANQEGVDIIIKATDQYTKTINNIAASNELFGKTVENTQKEIAALEKYMISLRVNGMKPTDEIMVKLKADYDNLTASLNSGEGALKQSTKQWTALSLVVQDLPYGFRGIQNNLPALLGSIAGVGGAAYFAFSALVAIYTAYGDQINDAIFKTSTLEKATKELGKANTESAKSTETARTELLKVGSVIEAAKNGYITKTAAIEYYNEKLGDSFGKVSSLGEAEQALIDKTPKYIEALMLKAKGELYFAKAAEYSAKKDVAMLTDQLTFFDKLYYAAKAITTNLSVGAKGVVGIFAKGLVGAQSSAATIAEQTAGEISDVLTKEGKAAMTAYFAALKNSGLSDAEIQSIIDKLNQKLLKTQQKSGEEKLKAIETANQAEIKAFISTLDERGKKEYEAGLRLAENLQAMRNAGYTDATTYYSAYRAEIDKIDAYYNNKEIEEARKTSEKIATDAEVIDNRQLQNSLDSLKIQSDVATKIANSSGKATSSERIAILEQYKNALYQLASVGGYTAEQFDKIDDALKRVDGAIAGSKDNLKDYEVSWTDTLNTINKAILDFVVNSVVSLSESLGQLLAGEKVQPFVALSELLANALSDIGKALITLAITQKLALLSLSNPLSWPIALAAGIAAVAAGAALKSSLRAKSTSSAGGSAGNIPAFASGGIISGPTMGLMGEYPGAKSNPEVVAPLDKLKDMLGGGGGGTFVLRGQDLLLSVNRAQKASNIKGQTISLA
jgi:hypothetical protein